MLAQQRSIDDIANNIANVNTDGYKRTRLDFRDALYDTMLSPAENGPGVNLQRGTGVLAYQYIRDFALGARKETGRTLDFSLDSRGFFAVEDISGQRLYTRSGAFYLSVEPAGEMLTDARGRYVLDQNGNRVTIRGEASEMTAAADGTLTFRMADGTFVTPGVRIGVYDFDNRAGLTDAGDGNFLPSANSGQARLSAAPEIRQGGLEASNVDFGYEATRLIRAQRAYQMSSRCVTVADQMAQLCNTIRN